MIINNYYKWGSQLFFKRVRLRQNQGTWSVVTNVSRLFLQLNEQNPPTVELAQRLTFIIYPLTPLLDKVSANCCNNIRNKQNHKRENMNTSDL